MTKKEFYECKEGIKLKDVIFNNIIVSEKVKTNRENALHSKYYIGLYWKPTSPHNSAHQNSPSSCQNLGLLFSLSIYLCY